MILYASILFVLISAIWLAVGLWRRNVPALFALNLLWWLGAFVSAYFTALAWAGRIHSENWEAIGFIYLALSFIIPVVVLILIELYFLRRWREERAKMAQSNAIALLIFLVLQIIAGFMSA